MSTKPKIKIIQYMYGTHEYFPWSEWINRRYCEKHGYGYVVRHDEPRPDRHVVWHKIPVILDELRECDYLLFLDADAVFYSQELTVENELFPELHGKPILMAQDCGNESTRWRPGQPNSGVLLVKNDERAKGILSEWNGVTDKDEEARWTWPPTQRALWKHVLPKYKDDLRVVPDYYIVQGRFGQFIRHYCFCSGDHRVNAMKALYKRLSLPHHVNTNERLNIKVVQYHWDDQNRSYQVNRKINEAYCRWHGYDYVVKTFVPRDDRSLRWSKIPAMREELHDCNFLLYLDADAFFYSRELRIENELIPLLKDKQIMMSANCAGEKSRHQPDKPNAGVVLVRNSEKAAEILRVWDETSERTGLENFRFHPRGEQETCFQTVWQEFADEVKLLKDYYRMNGLRGIFIRHLMEMKDEDRLAIQSTFLENRRNSIPVLAD